MYSICFVALAALIAIPAVVNETKWIVSLSFLYVSGMFDVLLKNVDMGKFMDESNMTEAQRTLLRDLQQESISCKKLDDETDKGSTSEKLQAEFICLMGEMEKYPPLEVHGLYNLAGEYVPRRGEQLKPFMSAVYVIFMAASLGDPDTLTKFANKHNVTEAQKKYLQEFCTLEDKCWDIVKKSGSFKLTDIYKFYKSLIECVSGELIGKYKPDDIELLFSKVEKFLYE